METKEVRELTIRKSKHQTMRKILSRRANMRERNKKAIERLAFEETEEDRREDKI